MGWAAIVRSVLQDFLNYFLQDFLNNETARGA